MSDASVSILWLFYPSINVFFSEPLREGLKGRENATTLSVNLPNFLKELLIHFCTLDLSRLEVVVGVDSELLDLFSFHPTSIDGSSIFL